MASENVLRLTLLEYWTPLDKYPEHQRVLHTIAVSLSKVPESEVKGVIAAADKQMDDEIARRFGEALRAVKKEDDDAWKIELKDRAAASAHSVHPNSAVSAFRVNRSTIRRDIAHGKKIDEVKQRVRYSLDGRRPEVRLDNDNLDENTLPDEAYQLIKNENLTYLVMDRSNYMTVPIRLFDVFSHIVHLSLSANNLLQTLPDDISKMSKLKSLDLTDCKQLISLPMGLVNLRPTLQAVWLFGCTEMRFPPHSIAVKLGLATQPPMEKSNEKQVANLRPKVEALLAYMKDPSTLLISNKDKEKEPKDSKKYVQADITVPHKDARMAFAEPHIEYKVNVLFDYAKWSVRRRYKQFKALHTQVRELLVSQPALLSKLPEFPPGFWESHTVEDRIVQNRAAAFQQILRFLTSIEVQAAFPIFTTAPMISFLEIDEHQRSLTT